MFRDREEAARMLADRLAEFRGRPNLLVLGLPRGGVPIAAIVAQALDARLDIYLVRKLGVPWQPELAFGAIAEGGVRVLDRRMERQIDPKEVKAVIRLEEAEIQRRSESYRGHRAPPKVKGRTVIVVDDGLATGSTMLAAVRALREQGAAEIIVAVPVSPPSTVRALAKEADQVISLRQPDPFNSVGIWYDNFDPVNDQTVQKILSAPRAKSR